MLHCMTPSVLFCPTKNYPMESYYKWQQGNAVILKKSKKGLAIHCKVVYISKCCDIDSVEA